MKFQHLTEEEVQQIASLHGMPRGEIALRFAVTVGTVDRIFRAHGVTRRRVAPRSKREKRERQWQRTLERYERRCKAWDRRV